jgi:hypothetical protein
MKQLQEPIALFLSVITLAGVLTCLAANSEGKEYCRGFTVETRTTCDQGCVSDTCTLLASRDPSTPTLAPPRLERAEANSQPVFLKIETDQGDMELEYSWENP